MCYKLETQLLGVISKLTCCPTTKMFSLSFWPTDKISVKNFGCFPVHPEQRCIPVDKISLPEERKSLQAFQVFTGFGTTSQSASISKQSALKIFGSLQKLIEHIGEYISPEESVWADAEAFVFNLKPYNRRSRYRQG